MTFKVGEKYVGEAVELKSYGAVLRMKDGSTHLLHISNIANEFVQDVSKYIEIGKEYTVTAIPGKIRAVELTLREVDVEKLIEEESKQNFDTLLERYLPRPDARDRRTHRRKYNKDKK